jgi:hypothetical protein
MSEISTMGWSGAMHLHAKLSVIQGAERLATVLSDKYYSYHNDGALAAG